MRKLFSTICFQAILLASTLFAAPGTLTFDPAKPVASSKLSVHYRPGDEMHNAGELTAFLFLWNRSNEPLLLELPLKQSGEEWISEQIVPLDTVVYISCKIVAGKKEDTNNNAWWGVPVYTPEGNPRERALMAQVQSIAQRQNGFNEAGTRDEAQRLLLEEIRMYPASPIWSFRWQLLFMQMSREKATEKVEKELDSLALASRSESDLLDCSVWYERLGDPKKADALLDTLIVRYKNQSAAVRKEIRPLRELKDMELIKTALANMIAAYPNAQEVDGLKTSMAQIAIQQKNFDEAAKYIETYGIRDLQLINSVARELMDAPATVAAGVRLAELGVKIARDARKPPYLPRKEWSPQYDKDLSTALAAQGVALAKNDRFADAEKVLAECLAKSDAPDQVALQTYIICLRKNGKPKETLPVYEKLIIAGFSGDQVEREYRAAYREAKGSEKGFETELKELKQKAFGEKFAVLKRSVVNQSIRDFALPAMAGGTVALEKLRGKVVVLDFWATWCGPCKQSFPHLQKVYDRFKSNDDVVIYAVNTFERSSGDARTQAVEKFIADNKYSFPVLFDSDVASSNGIQSIPTQFVIDKKGRIQFINVGFEGPQMVEELSMKIELLRSREFYE